MSSGLFGAKRPVNDNKLVQIATLVDFLSVSFHCVENFKQCGQVLKNLC